MYYLIEADLVQQLCSSRNVAVLQRWPCLTAALIGSRRRRPGRIQRWPWFDPVRAQFFVPSRMDHPICYCRAVAERWGAIVRLTGADRHPDPSSLGFHNQLASCARSSAVRMNGSFNRVSVNLHSGAWSMPPVTSGVTSIFAPRSIWGCGPLRW